MTLEDFQKLTENTPYREIRHYFIFGNETWQATLSYAKKEAEFAPPDTLVIAHNHPTGTPWEECFGSEKIKCKILKS